MRLEELADDTVGELALELSAACGENGHPMSRRSPLSFLEQPCLADPRRSFDQQDTTMPGARLAKSSGERVELRVTLEQLGRLAHSLRTVGRLRGTRQPLSEKDQGSGSGCP